MEGRVNISTDDLLDAIRAALEAPADGEGATVHELTATMACGAGKVRRALKALSDQGRLEVVRLRRTMIDGRPSLVPGYRIKPK
jgi:DNA-binding GntR family transcriptional regulator